MLTSSELIWLLASVAAGDRAAFERLYDATRSKLYAVVLRIVRRKSLANNVLQQTYLNIWITARQFDPVSSSPMTWMIAIARNHAIDAARMSGEKPSDENSDDAAESTSSSEASAPLARQEKSEELNRLFACMGKLDEDCQRLLLLAYYSGWNREQLAAEFDKPVDSIKAMLRRSLQEIGGCLSQ